MKPNPIDFAEADPRASDAVEWPRLTAVMPVRNEEPFIHAVLVAFLDQSYPADRWELLVVDGRSTDRTRDIVETIARRDPRIRLIDNPKRFVSPGLNAAILQARGEIIVRLDGHCEYPRDYLKSVVRLRDETQSDNAGGILVPVGEGFVQRAVALAYHSPVALGGMALRGHGDSNVVREVDAVHGGCWRRERLLAVGGFDDEMVRNQDDELSFRLRKSGGRIVQSSGIRVRYHVRNSFWRLFQQFAQYGYWKVRVIQKHPRQSSLRHFIPGGFVALLLALAAASWLNPWVARSFALILATYFLLVLGVSFVQAARCGALGWLGVALAVAAMHFGYGLGFLLGALRLLGARSFLDRFFKKVTR